MVLILSSEPRVGDVIEMFQWFLENSGDVGVDKRQRRRKVHGVRDLYTTDLHQSSRRRVDPCSI